MRSPVDDEYSEAFTADDDRILVLGHALLFLLKEAPDNPLSKRVMEFLDVHLHDPKERALLNLCPRLEDDDKVTPLRIPRDDF